MGYVFDGANGIWSNTAGGDWTSGGNWQSGLIASGKLGIADFSTLDISGTAAVQLNGSRTLGTSGLRRQEHLNSGKLGHQFRQRRYDHTGKRRSIATADYRAIINPPLSTSPWPERKAWTSRAAARSSSARANTYSGGTTIYAGSTLQVGDGGSLPIAGAVHK